MVSIYHPQSFEDFSRQRLDNVDAAEPHTEAQPLSPPRPQGRENAATRKARTRFWPDLSDAPVHFPSLVQRKRELQGTAEEIHPGKDSGRNMMAIFDDMDATPRTKFNIRCKSGRSKSLWPNWQDVKDVDIPVGLTLKHICRFYPLHCWGDGLRIFMAEGWSAEQIWHDLPRGARCDGATIRKWNYLQQAMGREADKMYEEAGNTKRVPTKRKKDDEDVIANARDADLGREAVQGALQSPSIDLSSADAHPMRQLGSHGFPDKPATSMGSSTLHDWSSPQPQHSAEHGINDHTAYHPAAPINMMPEGTPCPTGFYPIPQGLSNAMLVQTPVTRHFHQQSVHYQTQHPYIDPQLLGEAQYQHSTTNQSTPRPHSLSPDNSSWAAAQHCKAQRPAVPMNAIPGHVTGQHQESQTQFSLSQKDGACFHESANQSWLNGGQPMMNSQLVPAGAFDLSAFPSHFPDVASMGGPVQRPSPVQSSDQIAFHYNPGHEYSDLSPELDYIREFRVGNLTQQHPFLQNNHHIGEDFHIVLDGIGSNQTRRNPWENGTRIFFSPRTSGSAQTPKGSDNKRRNSDDCATSASKKLRAALLQEGFQG